MNAYPFIDKLVAKTLDKIALSGKVHTPINELSWSPNITISRDPGSGGGTIAKMITRKFDWKIVDKSIMSELAKDFNIPAHEFTQINQYDHNLLADTFQSLINPNYVSDIKYVNHLKRILIKSAKDGGVVIIGRGANLILPPDKTLRVRIIGTFKNRVDNARKYQGGKTKEEATSWVRNMQYRRSRFIRQYFHINPHNPWHYDVIVNTDNFTLKQACNIIINAYLVKFPSERHLVKSKFT